MKRRWFMGAAVAAVASGKVGADQWSAYFSTPEAQARVEAARLAREAQTPIPSLKESWDRGWAQGQASADATQAARPEPTPKPEPTPTPEPQPTPTKDQRQVEAYEKLIRQDQDAINAIHAISAFLPHLTQDALDLEQARDLHAIRQVWETTKSHKEHLASFWKIVAIIDYGGNSAPDDLHDRSLGLFPDPFGASRAARSGRITNYVEAPRDDRDKTKRVTAIRRAIIGWSNNAPEAIQHCEKSIRRMRDQYVMIAAGKGN